MAKTPQAVRDLLERVWKPARARALADRDAMQAMIQEEGGNFKLAPWDWRYYAEKLRKRQCDIDEATIKPYFQLHHIIEAAFYTAYKLFGLSFERAVTSRAGIRTSRPGRCATPMAAIAACSSAIISRAHRSAAAPG